MIATQNGEEVVFSETKSTLRTLLSGWGFSQAVRYSRILAPIRLVCGFVPIQAIVPRVAGFTSERQQNVLEPTVVSDSADRHIVYVPVYSHIYARGGKPYLLEATLSLRNTDTDLSISIVRVDYFDTGGKLVRSRRCSIPTSVRFTTSAK